MELRQYWSIVRGRLWLVALLSIVAFAVSVVYTPRSSVTYKASVGLAVKPQEQASNDSFYTYGEYYPYLASEFLNDDIGKVVEGGTFLAELRNRAAREYGHSPSGSLEVNKAHRVLTIDATSASSDDALLLVKVLTEMLSEPNSPYFNMISDQHPHVTVVDQPAITGVTPASRVGLDIAIRTLLGLVLGVSLAFLLNYLDDTVRSRFDLEEQMGLNVLGEIPR